MNNVKSFLSGHMQGTSFLPGPKFSQCFQEVQICSDTPGLQISCRFRSSERETGGRRGDCTDLPRETRPKIETANKFLSSEN